MERNIGEKTTFSEVFDHPDLISTTEPMIQMIVTDESDTISFIEIDGDSEEEILTNIKKAANRLNGDAKSGDSSTEEQLQNLIRYLLDNPLELLYDPDDEQGVSKVQIKRYLTTREGETKYAYIELDARARFINTLNEI